MKAIVILLAICVVSEIQCIDLCTLINPKGTCKSIANCNGEIGDYGSIACPSGTICCIAPDVTTPESTTEPTSTEPLSTTLPPTTTEESSTAPPTTALLVTEQCGVKPDDDIMVRIFGGAPKEIRDWPWMVSIRGKDTSTSNDYAALAADPASYSNTRHICAGVFIHEQYVVTTGYCILKLYAFFKTLNVPFEPLENIVLFAGDTITDAPDFGNDGSATEKLLKVAEIIPHENFTITDFKLGAYNFSTFTQSATYEANNLALLKLVQPVVFGENVRKCCGPNLTESATCALKKSGCFVAGWGDNEFGMDNDKQLKEAEVEVFTKEVADAAADLTGNLSVPLQSTARFAAQPGNVCDGDNGGMVVCQNDEGRWALEGLVSKTDLSLCNGGASFDIVDMKSAWPWIDSKINTI